MCLPSVKFSWPEVIELQDVKGINEEHVLLLRSVAVRAKFVHVIVGSPCQDLSGANTKRKEFGDKRTLLCYELLRVAAIEEERWPLVKISRTVENVKAMSIAAC
eukprot:3221291-Karenia_brevis.AAC.1